VPLIVRLATREALPPFLDLARQQTRPKSRPSLPVTPPPLVVRAANLLLPPFGESQTHAQ
jgi:hypothetical protein